ncbi:peptidase YpeB-like protein [Actinocorallia herbida]|uniref:Peptidase YpeB-like protein n=1 Tax=Actinocorallia herbida TaxID=58109 RepID=A0A3N1D6H9_9ACTN|nr:PepSY domain-containing protein [Actinocorallia herbida]ROO89141.1 peptidase YpeB-like protein [Actinocorallia herbida]
MPAKTVLALAFAVTAAGGTAAGAALASASADAGPRVPVAAVTETPATDTPTDETPTDDMTESPASPSAAPAVTYDQAMNKALEKAPGLVAGAELDDEGEKPTWQIDVLTEDDKWREITVDGATGEVTQDQESSGDTDEATAIRAAKVTAADAVKKATETQPGTLQSLEFENEDGKPMWNVDIKSDDGTEHELQVPADNADATPTPSPTSS